MDSLRTSSSERFNCGYETHMKMRRDVSTLIIRFSTPTYKKTTKGNALFFWENHKGKGRLVHIIRNHKGLTNANGVVGMEWSWPICGAVWHIYLSWFYSMQSHSNIHPTPLTSNNGKPIWVRQWMTRFLQNAFFKINQVIFKSRPMFSVLLLVCLPSVAFGCHYSHLLFMEFPWLKIWAVIILRSLLHNPININATPIFKFYTPRET